MAKQDDKAQRHHEVERKFVMAAEATMPDLGALAGVATVGEGEPNILDATYYDTATRSLTAHDVSLRRRTGGGDAGWHLKRPSAGAASAEDRQELRLPLGDGDADGEVPGELANAVRWLTRGRPLEPIVVLHTERLERTLCAEDGATLALVADDLVTVRRPHGDGEAISWHELEVELVDADPSFLEVVTEAFVPAGVHPATWPSKVRHGLELLGDEVVLAFPPPPRPQRRKATVDDVVRAHLRTNVDVIIGLETALRAADEDAVHDVRVSARRLRSAFATFRPFLVAERTEPLRVELKWFGQVLGAVRDADVLGARLISAARALPVELTLGPVVDRLDTELRRTHERAFTELGRVLDDPRTYALLDALEDVAASPFASAAGQRASRALPAVMEKEIRRVRRAGKAVDEAPNADARLAALHELRKTAKRARYAAESVEVVCGRPAKKLAGHMEDLQDALGEHQDTVAARAELRRIGALVEGYDGESGFTFGVLHEREAQASREALRPVGRLRRRATKRPFDPSR